MVTSTFLVSFVGILLCSSFNTVDARIVRRDVINPPITYPTSGTVWTVNERHNVTWDTSVIPPGTTSNGMIVLGFLDSADGTNEHLDLNNPLATNFPITAGRAEITVPSVTTRDTYILVLFGDSGNASGKFTIKNLIIGSPSSSTTTMAASISSAASSPALSSASPTTTDSGASSEPAASPSGAASSSPLGAAGGSGSPTSAAVAAQSTPTAPASSISSAAASSSVATSAGQTVTAAASGTTTPNAGVRTASRGRGISWMSTMCSLAIVLGFAL